MTDPASSSTRVVAITGASGLIGSALSEAVRERGDEVVHLVRRDTRPSEQQHARPGRAEAVAALVLHSCSGDAAPRGGADVSATA